MSKLSSEAVAVQTYINNMQSIINRMAANSLSVKTWCITLISAVMVFASDKDHPDAIWIAVIPLVLCMFLDSYYLGLERLFRSLYNSFVSKLISEKAESKDLFVLTPGNYKFFSFTFKALLSISIWPFYSLILVMLICLRSWIF